MKSTAIRKWIVLLFVLQCADKCYSETVIDVFSPSKTLQVRVSASELKPIIFEGFLNGHSVFEQNEIEIVAQGRIRKSNLYLARSNRFYKCLPSKILRIDGPSEQHDDYERMWGLRRIVKNRFSEVSISISWGICGSGRLLFRVFDDGFGYRIEMNRNSASYNLNEKARFRFPQAYSITAWVATGWKSYSGPLPLRDIRDVIGQVPSKFGVDAKTPITLKLSKEGQSVYLSFHEADLHTEGEQPYIENDQDLCFVSVAKKDAGYDLSMSWKTVTISTTAGGLVESDIIKNLNPPELPIRSIHNREFKDWVIPGLSMWDFRIRGAVASDGFVYGMNMETFKRLIDFCAEQKIPYLTVDDGWYHDMLKIKKANLLNLKILNVPSLASYAEDRGVRIILYVDFKALQKQNAEKILSTYHKWGVAGIKHGFASDRNSNLPIVYKEMVKILSLCAKYELVYTVHEPPKPSGWERTYPNFLTSEYTDSMLDQPTKESATSASQLVTLPFVHHLATPVDRNSGMFALDTYMLRDLCFRQIPSTVMSQIAQGFLFLTGLWTLVDTDEAYMAKPRLLELVANIGRFIVADESWVSAEIGKQLIITKRLGQEYLACGLTDDHAEVTLDLASFISTSTNSNISGILYSDGDATGDVSSKGPVVPKTYEERLAIASDKTTREHYEISPLSASVEEGNFTSGRIVNVTVNQGGGFCVFLKINNTDNKTG